LRREIERPVLPPPPPPPPISLPPKLPGDTTAPALELSGATSQKVLRHRGVLVIAASPTEPSTVTAKGKVVVRGSRKVFKLTPVTRPVLKGAESTLKLKVKNRALALIARAVKTGKKLSAKVTVTAKGRCGKRSH
jgi:hypothetical protein